MSKGKKKKKQQTPITPARKRSYAGAQSSRLLNDWNAYSTSADSELFGNLRTLRNRSRALARDNDYISGLLTTMANNIVGCGMTFQAQTQMQRGNKPNGALNQSIEAAWLRWSRAESCHAGGRLHWPDIEQLAARTIIQDGEVFLRKIRQPFGRDNIPYALEVIEADQIADDYSVSITPEGNTIKMGVELNQWNRPVAYWMYEYHPGDHHFVLKPKSTRPVRVLASEIVHLYRALRPNQTRGIPWIFSSMVRMQHVNKFEEAEVVATRAQSNIVGFIQRADDDTTIPNPEDSDDRVDGFEPGAIDYLNPGETFQGFAPTRPGDSFDPFMRAMLRALAAGQGISYASVSKDYSQTSFSSIRAEVLEERKQYKVLQNWLIRSMHTLIYEEWLEIAALSGAVKIDNFEFGITNALKHRWIPPGWDWVNPQQDTESNIDALRAGLTTATKIVSQKGEDYEELLQQRKQEIELADSMGLVFDLTGKGPPVETPGPPVETPEPPPDPPKKKDFLELLNGNGKYLTLSN
jgi:lambda family phage portal protein